MSKENLKEKIVRLIEEWVDDFKYDKSDEFELEVHKEFADRILFLIQEPKEKPKEKYIKVLCPECRRKGEIREDVFKEPKVKEDWGKGLEEINIAFVAFKIGRITEYQKDIAIRGILKELLATQKAELIEELGSNPNEDGSISPNIQHWIEAKQAQLKRLKF